MGTFIALLDFTDQGIRNIEDSTHRADQFAAPAVSPSTTTPCGVTTS